MENRYENCFARWKWRINEFVLTNKANQFQNLLLLIKKRATRIGDQDLKEPLI
jgi:hypothetical protein